MPPRSLPTTLALALAASLVQPAGAETRSATATVERTETPAEVLADARAALASIERAVTLVQGRAHYELRANFPAGALSGLWRTAHLAAALAGPSVDLTDLDDPEPAVLTAAPVPGELSSPFGYRRDPVNKRRRKHHNGVDFAADRRTPVHAAGPGVVVVAKRKRGYGRVVYIDHGQGVQTRYAHLQRILVREGEFVPRGAIVGRVGSSGRATGPHLHFEVRVGGRPVDPTAVVDTPLSPRSRRHRPGT